MFMSLILYNHELPELMEHFYILTGIRIVLFDENYTEIASYPSGNKSFCSCMRKIAKFDELCCKSDAEAFKKCRKSRQLTIHKCHAGLIEATAPLTDNGIVIGYVMFGQITDNKNRADFNLHLRELCEEYGCTPAILDNINIKYKSEKQILAASKILDACTSYILLKRMVKPSKERLLMHIEKYIDEHLDDNITVTKLCKEFAISRTQLYELMGRKLSKGVAAFIKYKRLTAAKDMLISTSLNIADIAAKAGFNDYNYFLRVFKKEFGISPKKFRIQMLNNGDAAD